jgi:predicted 2-oxoglutarate/Fe(II)-dependent dioxygenase YbiX
MYIPQFPIQPTEIAGGCIAIFENVWGDTEQTIKDIELTTSDPLSNISFIKAATLNNTANDKRTNQHLALSEAGQRNNTFREINNKFFNLTCAAVETYKQIFDIKEQIYFNEGFNLLKYSGGQEYKAHADGGTGTKRAISPILYLNDDYEGGEIEFVNFGLKLKPKPGMLVLFPSNYPYRHIAHPVTDGTKYAIVTWLHDQP